jgi:hypothetical protein
MNGPAHIGARKNGRKPKAINTNIDKRAAAKIFASVDDQASLPLSIDSE